MTNTASLLQIAWNVADTVSILQLLSKHLAVVQRMWTISTFLIALLDSIESAVRPQMSRITSQKLQTKHKSTS